MPGIGFNITGKGIESASDAHKSCLSSDSAIRANSSFPDTNFDKFKQILFVPIGPPGADGFPGRRGQPGFPGLHSRPGAKGDKGFRGDDCGFCAPGLAGDKGDSGEIGTVQR